MKFSVFATAAALILTSAAAYAQTATPGIDKQEMRQQHRIAQGIASGQLTAKEAGRLENGEAKLQADKAAAKADGKVTAAERKKLHRETAVMDKRILRQKHDAQKTNPAQ